MASSAVTPLAVAPAARPGRTHSGSIKTGSVLIALGLLIGVADLASAPVDLGHQVVLVSPAGAPGGR
ncbi:hypothetical protein [Marmoricola endophyticus]|nr:hypothetical protein [Marmoricola endophyticus]